MNNMHVVIAGAGLGGLCLAQGLKKNGISFEVFEKDPARNSRTQGYRIRIDRTGQQALQHCLPESLYTLFKETCALPSAGVRTLDTQLEKRKDKWIDAWEDGQSEELADLKADRMRMRELLLSGIEEHVHFDRRITGYKEREDGRICALFADGSTTLSDVLIAADGAYSKLREQRFPGTGPVDTGNICIYGKTFPEGGAMQYIASELQTGTTAIFGTGLAIIIDAMRFSDNNMRDYIYWAMIGSRDQFGLKEIPHLQLASARLQECIGNLTTPWSPALQSLFALADPEAIAVVPVRTSIAREPWKASRVTALGDAVHTMSPAAGLGANSALYDAGILAEKLAEVIKGESSLPAAIAAYEHQMREHSFASIRASQEGGVTLFGK
jgi:2-polyprenyl-6-methoxyphenol hydroxylase-like FAD-dependent oxidoreductase